MARRSRRSTRRKIGGGKALEDARLAYRGNMKDDNIRQRLINELTNEISNSDTSDEDKKTLQIELEGVERGESLDLIYARLAYIDNMKDETIRQRLIDELKNEINNNSEKDTTALSKELEDLETLPSGAPLADGKPLQADGSTDEPQADGKPLQADGSTDEPQADGSTDEPQADGSSDDGTSDDGSSDGEPPPAGVGGRRRRKSRRSRRRRKSRRSRRRRKSRQSRRPRKSRRTRRSRRSRRH